jgi:hypothetical protein
VGWKKQNKPRSNRGERALGTPKNPNPICLVGAVVVLLARSLFLPRSL